MIARFGARSCAALLTTVTLVAGAPALRAQDTTSQRGVRIGLTYQTGAMPGVVVLPIAGPEGDSLRAIVVRDLDYGHRVSIVAPDAATLAAPGLSGQGRPLNYALLAKLGAAAALQLTRTASGLHVVLHDIAQQKLAAVEDIPVAAPFASHDWRWTVHGVADLATEWITGQRGIAQTRIAFERGKRLWLVDSDGAMETPVRGVTGEPMSPAWSPDGQRLAYSTYGVASSAMVVDLRSGRVHVASATPGGLNATPEFTPDGQQIVYAHGLEDGTDIYAAPSAGGGPARRLTVGRGSLNISPTISPDGRRIAFTTSRSGPPEVYVMDADGTNAELLTPFIFGEDSYQSNPDWSPDGRQIAYQARVAGRFQIKAISLRDRSTRQLTDDGTNEDPSWAPDGRHLVFVSTRSGVRQLWVLDTETNVVRQLTHGAGGARLPAWSPRGTGATAP